MKAAIITRNSRDAARVFPEQIRAALAQRYELCGVVLSKGNLNQYADLACQTQFLFATWGMEHFTTEEIRQYFPNLKAVFYAAGSVQGFAKEFLGCGVARQCNPRGGIYLCADHSGGQGVLSCGTVFTVGLFECGTVFRPVRRELWG